VVGAARFSDTAARAELEAAGVECVPIDLVAGDVGGLPADADYVLNFAVAKTNDWESDLAANSGGLASLMEHHRGATAFLHCSSTAVYKPAGHQALDESAPLGDNHGVWSFLQTYSICKIAAEGTARWAAQRFGVPTTIARLSVPYGDNGGWPAIHLHMMLSGSAIPVYIDAPSVYHPLHADDIFAMVPRLLAAASVPALTVNWGGSEPVSIEEWCTYLGELTGVEPRFDPTEQTIDSVQIDTTRMHEVAGPTTVPWRDGMHRMVRALHPDKVA
jgi:nucleoside-diphosphate-sugar epimerase